MLTTCALPAGETAVSKDEHYVNCLRSSGTRLVGFKGNKSRFGKIKTVADEYATARTAQSTAQFEDGTANIAPIFNIDSQSRYPRREIIG